ncbi:MAG: ABC transporter substrate-binding protein [Pseudomonadota bacterium]|nr:ABC transporter substrate-binding protein [Pseudomonadota bacterium]
MCRFRSVRLRRRQLEARGQGGFRKNTAYRPRAGKPSWGAGGKVVNVDTVEWISIKDHNTAVNALISGEVDYIESPPVDLLPLLEAADNVKVEVLNKLGNQLMFRLNHLHPPFNNVKARRAALAAIDQIGFLKAVICDPRYYKECPAMFMCGSSLATDKGADIIMKSDYALSKKLLKEAGYDGTPILVMCNRPMSTCSTTWVQRRRSISDAGASKSICKRWIGKPWSPAGPKRTNRPTAGGTSL